MIDADPMFSTDDLAERWNVATETVRRWIRDGKLRAVTLPGGRIKRIPAEEVQRYEQSYGSQGETVTV